MLYEAESKDAPIGRVLAGLPVPPDPYVVVLVDGVARRQAEIDALLAEAVRGWALDHMPVVDRCLCRLAAYELLEQTDVPVAVVIDEAVELAKAYSTAESGRFVNGVLSTLAERVRPFGDRAVRRGRLFG